MKRIISFCLSVLCVLTILPVNVSAKSEKSGMPETKASTLLLDTGESIEIMGSLVEEDIELYNNRDEYSVTYEYALDSQTLEHIERATHSNEATDEDPTLSVRAYLTLKYKKESGFGSGDNYLLTGVSGHWEILDKTVGVTSAKLGYQIIGYSAYEEKRVYEVVTDISVSNNFSKSTGLTDYIVDDGFSTCMASLILNMKMGNSRTWSWKFDNQLF